MVSRFNPIAPLYTLRKDHKNGYDMSTGPPSRPVCNTRGSLSEKMAFLMSGVIDKVWQDNKYTTGCQSTEELLAEVDELNIRLEGGLEGDSRVVVGSLDVKALYPNIDVDFAVGIIGEMFEGSDVMIEGIDYEEMGLYLSYNMEREEMVNAGIEKLCPTRRHNRRPPIMQAAGIREDKEQRFAPWIPPVEQPNEGQKRRMLTEAVKVAIKFIMKNHVYSFDNNMYKQARGGPIGLNLTGTIAQVVMLWWDGRFKAKLQEMGIEVLMYKRYVDDINMCTIEVAPGVVYENGQVVNGEVSNSEEKADTRTFRVIKSIGDDIHQSVQLEVDTPSNHDDLKVPILDVKMYVNNGRKVMYEFYAKEVSTKSVLNARSAAPWTMKRTVLTQEVLRVLLNCSPDLEWEVKKQHIENMVARMQFSGYNKKFRSEVVDSAMKAFYSIQRKAHSGERPIHRPRTWKAEERAEAKVEKKKVWYQNGGHASVIFIPTTPGSALKKTLQQEIDKSEFKIKVVEKIGKTVKQHLQTSDPFRGLECRREDCPVCSSGGRGKCDQCSVLYKITCVDCGAKYHGESGRNAYCRTREHKQKLEEEDAESPLWRHCVEKHDRQRQDFKFDVLSTFRNDAMLRQISESVAVNRTKIVDTMNGKTEWNQPRVPRAVVQ